MEESKQTCLLNMNSFIESLKKDVRCSLCNGQMTDPKILPCFHTFCKACIETSAELTEEFNVFKCPKCKTLISLRELNSVEDLKSSVLHSRILDVLALVEDKKNCHLNKSHYLASWYCFDCSRSMCHICVKNHTTFVDNHMVMNLDELKLQDLEFILKREDDCTSCQVGQRVEVFCRTCQALICVFCMKQEHKEHELTSLDTFATVKREILAKHLNELEKFSLDEQKVQEQRNIALLIKENGEKVVQEVKERTKELINYLKQSEQELLMQIHSKMDRANKNLNIIHHIPAVKEYINNVMERGLASDMVNIQELTTECHEDYIFSPIQKNDISEIVFVPNHDFLHQMASGIGEIQTRLKTDYISNQTLLQHVNTEPEETCSGSSTDHTVSTIQVESVPVALKQGTLVLTTKTSSGEPNHDPSDVINIKISPEENVEIKENHVRTEGKMIVEFMAKVAGQLTAEVQVNGNHVSNSPLVMNVMPQEMGITKFQMKNEGEVSHTLTGVAVNNENSKVAVANESSSCVQVFNTAGDLVLKYGRKGRGERQLLKPEGLAFLNDTDLVIADNRNYRLCIVNTNTGALVKTFGQFGKGEGEFNDSYGVYADENGDIVACDYHNERVQIFTKDSDFQYQFGLTKQDNFHPVSAVTHHERFYVSDYTNNVIHVFEKKDGAVPTRISTIGEKGSADGQLREPWGLAIDKDHHLLVCDRGNNRVQKFTLDGRFVGVTREKLKDPRYITVLNDGNLLVTTFRSGLFVVNKILETENGTPASPSRRSTRTTRTRR